MPGEPIILMFTGPIGTNPKNVGCMKTFTLNAPGEQQLGEYFNFVIRSIYRLQSEKLYSLCSEDEFIDRFRRDQIPAKRIGKMANGNR